MLISSYFSTFSSATNIHASVLDIQSNRPLHVVLASYSTTWMILTVAV